MRNVLNEKNYYILSKLQNIKKPAHKVEYIKFVEKAFLIMF